MASNFKLLTHAFSNNQKKGDAHGMTRAYKGWHRPTERVTQKMAENVYRG